MNRVKYLFRVIFFLLTVLMLVQLNRKTDANTETIVEFKFKMLEKIRTDSLDSKGKVDMLVDETTKFVDDSVHIKKGIHYLIGLLTIWVIVEVGFYIRSNRNYQHEGK